MGDEDAFLQKLMTKAERELYIERKKAIEKETRREFEKRRPFYITNLQKAIEDDRKHRDLLNCCIYPFTGNGPLSGTGYRFIRASPLFECGMPNMDFLIAKIHSRMNIAIFGECKGSIADTSQLLREMNTRRNTIHQQVDYIRRHYLNLSADDPLNLEYVIAVPSQYSNEVLNKVIEKDAGFIVWHAPFTGPDELSIAFPPRELLIHRERMIHCDPALNEALQHIPTDRKAFNFFPQMHSLTELYALVIASSRDDPGFTIQRDHIIELLSKDLFYMDTEYIAMKADEIICRGTQIEFLEGTDDAGVYRIRAQGLTRQRIARSLEEKWKKNRCLRERTTLMDVKVSELKAEMEEELKKQKLLNEFPGS